MIHPPRPTGSAERNGCISSGACASTVDTIRSKYFWAIESPILPWKYRLALKCSIAYFIASLFTFSPYLSSLISNFPAYNNTSSSPSPVGYLVATVSVHFNPAKTIGAMVEADLYCLVGLIYSAFVCLSSVSLFWWLQGKSGWDWLASILVILWIGVHFGFMGWMKVWMNHPSFSVGDLVKEGGLEPLLQTSFIAFCGAVISNLACYFIWPQSATAILKANIVTTLDSFSNVLESVTSAFCIDDGIHNSILKLENTTSKPSSFATLKNNLRESQSEWIGRRRGGPGGRLGKAYEDALDSMNRLKQHLDELRTGRSLRYDLVRQGQAAADLRDAAPACPRSELLYELQPALKSLSKTCTWSLMRMRQLFSAPLGDNPFEDDFFDLTEEIEGAIFRFDGASNHTLRNTSLISYDTMNVEDHEYVSVVCFFIFTLKETATELISLADATNRIFKLEHHARPNHTHWWTGIFRSRSAPRTPTNDIHPPGRVIPKSSTLKRRFSSIMIPKGLIHPSFPKIRPHAPNTMHTPSYDGLTFIGKIKMRFWSFGRRVGEADVRHAFKVGGATAILAAPAFFEATRLVFLRLWGHWALISFFVVMSPTLGETNFSSLHRVLGTIFGATVAAIMYTLFPENPVTLAIFGFLFSLPCFYYNTSASRFILLTYNLTCLYCYNVRERAVSVVEVAILRAIAVTAGVLWAALVARVWWPAEARREFGRMLGEFCLEIGWLYTRLEAANPYFGEREDSNSNVGDPERRPLLPRYSTLDEYVKELMAMELHLQLKLLQLRKLLDQTQHEPRLKGPFPVELYRGILESLGLILGRLRGVRCVTMREEWCDVRREFILPVNARRREMAGNVVLSFSTLAAAFQLKAPLPPYLPSPDAARGRFVCLSSRSFVKNLKKNAEILFFAYALLMRGLTGEVEGLGRVVQEAFGVVGGAREGFEGIFDEEGEI
ncbi:Fusaric acid resistance protein-like-domain-containing protein [Favolaschia claudopus]|uniref:Fusaric acid resistance protein-like-domain-containing protein n=1 Tax=Favolaschia claudopus TaxID=2862362 RepID=A0AAW0DUB5_9AGAR